MRNNRNKNRFFRCAAAFVLILTLCVGVVAAASELEENKDKLDDVQQSIDRIEEERKATEERLKQLQADRKDAESYIVALQAEIDVVMAEVTVMTEEKFAVMQQIEAAEQSLAAALTTADDQYEKMKLRIQYMYERGDTQYLEMLLSAEGFTDFLTKTEYISKISEYDRGMLDVYQSTVEEIETVRAQCLERQKELAAWERELSAKEVSLLLLAEEKDAELRKLEGLIDDTEHLIVDYDEALKEEKAELLKIQKEIQRLEEEERKRKEEEEKKKQEQANQNTGNQGSSQQVSSKGMIWPVASCTRITSYFGHRVDPLTGEVDGTLSNHKGIDVALPNGALEGAPISAAAGGTVIIARKSTSAGNWVILYHGNSTYTVYMHMQKILVSEGQTVSQGQTIGLVGNTGWSTGAHLHFEVRIGGFIDSSYSRNPLEYVNP